MEKEIRRWTNRWVFVTEHEYIFGYRKSSQFIWNDKHEKIDQNEYKYTYSDGSLYKIIKLEKWGSSSHKEDRPTMYFPIKDPDGNDLYPIAPDKKMVDGELEKKDYIT